MVTYKAPLRDIEFALNDVLDYPAHYQSLANGDISSPLAVDAEMTSAILEGAAKFSEGVLAPLNQSGDQQGCKLVNGEVQVPDGFRNAYQQFVQDGWMSLGHSEELGGQGLPKSLNMAVHEMIVSANHAWTMYVNLTWGAVATILHHASEELKNTYLPKLVQGEWSGTMCLTEAHCGSDLGLLRTRAEPNDDGSYSITGSKIFISSGDHDLSDNIVHIVLARLPDAPVGTKGISLFVVPKFLPDSNGESGAKNDVSCGSLEEKMGIHGNATCVMNFDGSKGYLVGELNKGLNCMFTFINESRLEVAQQANGHIESSFQKSLEYARERLQMRAPVRPDPSRAADPIIVHPDVRRMLLTQKAFAEGNRLLSYYCAQMVDLETSEDTDKRRNAQTMLALLTPIVKGFVTETSLEATSHGIQIFGGHGYVSEWGVEQEYRDTRITAIYEGTNGIQGLDLLGRKVLATKGEILKPLVDEVNGFCAENDTSPFAHTLSSLMDQWQELNGKLAVMAADNPDEVNAAAWDYLMFSGYTVLAYLWMKAAVVAEGKLADGSSEQDFYNAKLKTARFYFERLLPRAQQHVVTLMSGSKNLMELDENSFCF